MGAVVHQLPVTARRRIVRHPDVMTRFRGAIADLSECAAEFRPNPNDLVELAGRLARIADAFEGRADE